MNKKKRALKKKQNQKPQPVDEQFSIILRNQFSNILKAQKAVIQAKLQMFQQNKNLNADANSPIFEDIETPDKMDKSKSNKDGNVAKNKTQEELMHVVTESESNTDFIMTAKGHADFEVAQKEPNFETVNPQPVSEKGKISQPGSKRQFTTQFTPSNNMNSTKWKIIIRGSASKKRTLQQTQSTGKSISIAAGVNSRYAQLSNPSTIAGAISSQNQIDTMSAPVAAPIYPLAPIHPHSSFQPTSSYQPTGHAVETAFNMNQDNQFLVDQAPILQQPLNLPAGQDKGTELYTVAIPGHLTHHVFTRGNAPGQGQERFGFKYPKGIPRSFLQNMPEAWPNYQTPQPVSVPMQTNNVTSPLSVQTDGQADVAQQYSPSELYNDTDVTQGQGNEETELAEQSDSGQERVSAFRRLGPVTQPKKPKITINIKLNKDQEDVREVVDQTEVVEGVTPVHLREELILSTDETVMKYLRAWPWKRKVAVQKSVTARSSKTVMMLEKEQMEEAYAKDGLFVQVSITGYPPFWTKENVIDVLMENTRGYSFIPCFIEFTKEECKFLTLRCRSALLCFHKCGFIIRKDGVELVITLAQTELTINNIDFIPRLVLVKRLQHCVDGGTKLDLSRFTLKEDISHFIYFPLNREYNQTELVQLHAKVSWQLLTDLILSHNRISTLDGFELVRVAPNLKLLDLSHNCIERITSLLCCRSLPLQSLYLEGNPLCTDYIDPTQYVKVIRMMFPVIKIIDDVPVLRAGDMPKLLRYYCPESAKILVEKFIEMYFRLLDGQIEHRELLTDMYEDSALMTITFDYRLSFNNSLYRCYRPLFKQARQLENNKLTIIKGSEAIVNNLTGWPQTEHDMFTFTVDVLYHNDSTAIIRIDGILKLTRDSLAEEEHLLAFSRTVVLQTKDGAEYKIQNEMLHWSMPSTSYGKSAFTVTGVKTKLVNPKIDSTTDEKLQKELLGIFMKITSMDEKISERCLEIKKWNLKEALDHFSKLLRLNSLDALTKDS